MSTTEQYFEAIADYDGVEGVAKFLRVQKGDVVQLIKKKHKYLKVEKDGHVGKVPKRILVQKSNLISQIPMDLPIQTAQHSPQIMNSMKTQNGKEPIKSMIPIDKQKSQINPPGQKEQIKQQSDNLQQSITNPKSHSGSGSSKSKRKQKAPKYQLNQLHQTIKDIHSIIESNTINDEQKVIKIREIYNELKKKDKDELRKIFNIDTFKLIQYYINDCRSVILKILLDIIELISEQKIMYSNQFFNDIENSGLLNKIKLMIKDKIKEEKEQIKYSNETEQLIRIQIQINKGRVSDQQMINSYIQVIEKNINNLLHTINKLKEENNKGNKNEQENEVIEREIKQSAKLTSVIHLIREQDPNLGIRIPYQITNILKERIVPLIHLNCPTNINCQQCINIPQSSALLELKSTVILTLNEVFWFNYQFKEILVNDHNIIPHLTHSLIQFASQSQFNKRTNSQEQHDQQQTEQSSSISLITYSINLLNNIIYNNNNKYKEVINTPKALHSLTTLSIYKIGTHFNQENDQQTLSLRSGSRGCLGTIQFCGDVLTQSELVNANYTRILIIAISTANGHGEEKDKEIYWGLDYISNFLRCLNKGKQYSFPPQLLLAHRSDEQIEEEGGNEEIDSQQINKKSNYNIKNNAIIAKGAILNNFIEQGNTRPYWY